MSTKIPPHETLAYTVEVAARHLHISEARLRAWIEAGYLHYAVYPDAPHACSGLIDSAEVRELLRRGWTPLAAVPVPPPAYVSPVLDREQMLAALDAASGRRRRKSA